MNKKSAYGVFLMYAGRVFFSAVVFLTVLNIFTPILFSIDENCMYHAGLSRYLLLIVQIVLLLLSSLNSFVHMYKRNYASVKRYRTLAFFGLIMAIFLTIQLWFPYLPLYTIAYMVGTCLLHTFVVNDEKEEYKYKLEKAFEREKLHFKELKSAQALAHQDALTGVKNKLAYIEAEEKKDLEIKEGNAGEFAIAVFDINELKMINDKFGHEKGDKIIIHASETICNHFKHSPVFRIGGDEFLVLLEKTDYQNRNELKNSFKELIKNSDSADKVIISIGMSDYISGKDSCLNDVFVRADQLMSRNKSTMKSK